MINDTLMRNHLLELLEGRGAHMPFEQVVANFPPEKMNVKPPNVDYTPYHLIEHLRIAQWDILDYIRNPDYEYRDFPAGYWPAPDATCDTIAWNKTVSAFLSDLNTLKALVADPKTNLSAQIPHGQQGHNIIREVRIITDHNAYHIGELGVIRQIMQAW